MENYEFITLLVALLAGHAATFGMIWDVRQRVCTNKEEITKTNAKMELEFAKCTIHCKQTGGKL